MKKETKAADVIAHLDSEITSAVESLGHVYDPWVYRYLTGKLDSLQDLKGKLEEEMSMSLRPKIICVDFDGVIHSYSSGWKGPRSIPDPPVEGAIEWLERICNLTTCTDELLAPGYPYSPNVFMRVFEVHIFSSRSKYWFGRRAMKKWLCRQFKAKYGAGADDTVSLIKFPLMKPPAHLIIDDRAMQFKGEFPGVMDMYYFKPWNRRDE